jgi:hypothetical protein
MNYAYILLTDTVISSFPAKNKSELSIDSDALNRMDFMESDELYDSTDIWRAVQRELRRKTSYGQRSSKSALDLAWTIVDQARGVLQKRDLHPHLQFLQMFEIEINEIVNSLLPISGSTTANLVRRSNRHKHQVHLAETYGHYRM